MLDRVKNYDPNVVKGKFGIAGLRWMLLFIFDFAFSITGKKDKNGKVTRKLESKSFIGDRFRTIHKACVKVLEKKNPELNQVYELPSIDADDFDEDFFKYWRKEIHIPLVIKGYLKGAPILEEAKKEALVRDRGDVEIQCVDKSDKSDYRVGQNLTLIDASLKDFLTLDKYKDHYINNFYGVLGDEDFDEKCKGKELDNIQGRDNILTHWFISRSNITGSSLHCAGGENMFLNIVGRKEWYFISPSYTPVIQCALSKYAAFAISEMKEEIGDDFRSEILKDYPYMNRVPFYRTVLEEGDVLFNPSFWWHTVRNLTDYNVGCATRYLSDRANSLPIGICMAIDVLKNPKKSNIVQTIRMIKGKQSKKEFVKIIFSSDDHSKDKKTQPHVKEKV